MWRCCEWANFGFAKIWLSLLLHRQWMVLGTTWWLCFMSRFHHKRLIRFGDNKRRLSGRLYVHKGLFWKVYRLFAPNGNLCSKIVCKRKRSQKHNWASTNQICRGSSLDRPQSHLFILTRILTNCGQNYEHRKIRGSCCYCIFRFGCRLGIMCRIDKNWRQSLVWQGHSQGDISISQLFPIRDSVDAA